MPPLKLESYKDPANEQLRTELAQTETELSDLVVRIISRLKGDTGSWYDISIFGGIMTRMAHFSSPSVEEEQRITAWLSRRGVNDNTHLWLQVVRPDNKAWSRWSPVGDPEIVLSIDDIAGVVESPRLTDLDTVERLQFARDAFETVKLIQTAQTEWQQQQ